MTSDYTTANLDHSLSYGQKSLLRTLTRAVIASFVIAVIVPLTAMGRDVSQQITDSSLNQALSRLDSLLEQRSSFFKIRENSFRQKKNITCRNTVDSVSALLSLADDYSSYCSAYAIKYANSAMITAQSNGLDSLAAEASFILIRMLPQTRLVHEAIHLIEKYDSTAMPQKMNRKFNLNAATAYATILYNYTEYPELAGLYKPYWDIYFSRLNASPGETDPEIMKLLQAKDYYFNGDYYASADLARNVLEHTDAANPVYAEAAKILARCYYLRNGKTEQAYYLTLAAISTVVRADRESLALSELGNLIYSDKRLTERADNYLAAAIFYVPLHKAVNRTDILLESITNLENGYHRKWVRNMILFWSMLGIILLSVAMLVMMLIRNRRNYKRLLWEKELVANANNNKETFMKNFLEMCVLSTERMNDFCRLASRKITAKQIEDLYQIIHSGRIMDAQRKEFLRLFDKSFLQAFPTFIDELNLLLRPDEQYSLADGQEHLPPELRVYAMIRLGIDDVSRMAKSMGYSTNTVYVYRGKVKSKAINKQTFDADFAKIGTV